MARAAPLAGLLVLAPAAGAAAGPEAPPAQPFEGCRADLVAWAAARGVPRTLAEALLGTVEPDPGVLAATTSQGEFVRPIWAYLDAAVTEARVAEGQRKLADWAPTLAAIEAMSGVDRHVLVAFWGVESSYGAVLADPGVVRPVVRSLATLACAEPVRAAYWRDELTAALRITASGAGPAGALTGSWAGAMGHTQFMPTVYEADAVDFDGDGRRDIWTSVPDALASTANYLRRVGWRPGERWGFEVRLPEGFDVALADESTRRSLAAWRRLGLRPAQEGQEAWAPSTDAASQATLVLPAGIRGPAFLLQGNTAAILRYNAAFPYALSVGHLADRLRGEPGLGAAWPRGDRALTTDERREVQERLASFGHAIGAIDGKIGPRTRAAVRAYQATIGAPPDGYADAALLERIRAAP